MRRFLVVIAIMSSVLALSACVPVFYEETSTTHTETVSLTVERAWVKASTGAMTAAFGEITNNTNREVTILRVESPASPDVELHETVTDETGAAGMRQKQGGFVIPPHQTLVLAPGEDHVMLMSLPRPLEAGEEVAFTLVLSGGQEFSFTAQVKDFSGANENYDGGTSSHG